MLTFRELYNQFAYDPSSENHRKLAQPLYELLTREPLTATLHHVDCLPDNKIGNFNYKQNKCMVLDNLPLDKKIITMGHELGHAWHRYMHTSIWETQQSLWEETQTELFELWYTRKLEEVLDTEFPRRYIPQQSALYPHVQQLARLNASELEVLHNDFERTVQTYKLPITKPFLQRFMPF